jgi:excisionase family DNA binding protein
VDVTQAAKLIGISPSKLYQLVASHQIAHYRIGGKIVFDESDLAAFRSSCRVPAIQRSSPPIPPLPRLKHLRLSPHPTAR